MKYKRKDSHVPEPRSANRKRLPPAKGTPV